MNPAALLFFQESKSILSPYIEAAILLWPVWTVIVLGLAALYGYRLYEKTGLRHTNEATIDGLEGLLETRDRQLAAKQAECESVTRELETLKAEYKTIAGLVLADLVIWAGRYEFHLAELAATQSQLRIANERIAIMEKREAESLEIHKSQ